MNEEKVTLKIKDINVHLRNKQSPVDIDIKIENFEISGISEEIGKALVKIAQDINERAGQ